MIDTRKKPEEAIENAWSYVFDKLWYAPLHQIYDYLIGDTLEETLAAMPTPEEIRESCPNPCGWGTGMEDSTLSMGTVLETVLAKYAVTGDDALKKTADDILDGLIRSGTAAPERGFIARAVSPIDGKSIYMDSSRDQYTNWVYAAHLAINSDLVSEEQKAVLRQILVWIAEKCERDVKPETGGWLMRLDGKPGIVSRLVHDGLGPHEYLRLPMFYMAAYEASGDEHWKRLYRQCADVLLPRAEKNFSEAYWRHYAVERQGYIYGVYQHQYSAKLLWDCEEDEAYRARYLKQMRRAAEYAEFFMQEAYRNMDAVTGPEPRRRPWREGMEDGYNYASRWVVPTSELFYGYRYQIPEVITDTSRPLQSRYLRNAAEAVIVQCLCPGYAMTDFTKRAFLEFVEKCDFSGASTYWPMLFCDAWWLAQKTGQI